MTPKTPSTTISTSSLLQGRWENEQSTRPSSPSHQRLSVLSTSSSLYDSFTQLSNENEESNEEFEKVDLECSVSSIARMTPVISSSSTTTSTSSLLQGRWENDPLTQPSSPSYQRSSILSISSSLYDSFTTEADEEIENVDLECSASIIDDKIQVQLVETQLLSLVDRQDDEGNSSTHSYHGHNHPFSVSPSSLAPMSRPDEYPCSVLHSVLPSPPIKWPQSPIMLRPTPSTQMKIHGVRYANSTSYQDLPGVCTSCILPINTGYELPGQSLVIDFESPLFIGTFLMRVKGVSPFNSLPCSAAEKQFAPAALSVKTSNATTSTDASKPGYFDGKKRQFQVVIKGRFKQDNIPISDCVTGQVFDRPAGKLPARVLVNAFVKFISVLAPQLEVELDGNCPRFLSPLVATAHTVIMKDHSTVKSSRNSSVTTTLTTLPNNMMAQSQQDLVDISVCAGSDTMEGDLEEPSSNDLSSVMTILPSKMKSSVKNQRTVLQRRAARKKAFNCLAASRSAEPTFDVNKEYIFEFYQHLLLLTEPDDFKIDLGRNIQVGLASSLNGQPIKILAARKSRPSIDSKEEKFTGSGITQVLWSFDLWHEALYSLATASHE